MNNQHTPGPWTLTRFTRNGKPEKYQTVISQYNHIAKVFDVPPGAPTLCTGDANARLIAAAPDLLATLEECVKVYEEHRDQQPTGHLWPDPNYIFRARQAIKKARGES